jgi:Na+-driven multidrug efflux pump
MTSAAPISLSAPLAEAVVAPGRSRDPRTRVLLEAPIVPTLLRMAAPNVLVMLTQASTGLVETYFVGKLGTDALAGLRWFFPASC